MKTKPVPTSPKVRKKEKVVKEIYAKSDSKSFERPTSRSKNGIFIIVLAILAGFIAGILGEAFLNALAVSYPNLPVINQLYLKNYSDDSKIIVQKSEKSLAAQELEIQETLRQLSPAVVTIFVKKTDQDQADPLAQSYQIREAKGNGIVLTNDGLIMTTSQVIGDLNLEYVALTAERQLYPIKDFIVDPATEAIFFRIEAKNLSVVEFIDPIDLKVGQNLLTLRNKTNGLFEAVFTKLRDINYLPFSTDADLIYSSEFFSERFLISDDLPHDFISSPLATTTGKVIGVALKTKESSPKTNLVLPSHYFRSVIPRILKQGTVDRVFLGIKYLELGRTVNISEDISQGQTRGALLYQDTARDILAVQEASPAQKAGLQSGDIIIKVGETEIKSDNSLIKLIQGLQPKDKVKLIILRDRKERTLEVELERLKE